MAMSPPTTTYGGVAEHDRSTRTPLTADTDTACERSAPVGASEDLEEAALAKGGSGLELGLDTMLDDRVLVFLL